MLANMAASLIMNKRIATTEAKAKALRTFVEPLLTRSKEDSTHSRRVVFGYLRDKNAVSELFREVSPKIGDRPGGYTRILKTGNRFGDNADMCIIELVDFNENMLSVDDSKAKASTRRRGTKKKSEVKAVSAGSVAKPEMVVVENETIEEKPMADAITDAEIVSEENINTPEIADEAEGAEKEA
jgi:large subunit ribosomal protein L17